MNLGTYYLILYTFLAILLGLWVFIRLRRAVNRNEDDRLSLLRRRKRFNAVETKTPLDDPKGTARKIGVESIQTRFAVIRRLLLPAAVGLVLLLAVLPMLSSAPAAYASFFVGMVTVILGIAAKPVIENIIAGLVLSLGQPLRIGDTLLIDEHYGTVEDLRLAYTVIKIWDWRRYVIPNSKLLQKEFVNYSIVDRYQWAYVEFYVAPEADLELVRSLAIDAVKASSSFVDYEEPAFWVMGLEKEAVRCWVAGWTDGPAQAWALKNDARMFLSKAFQIHGIRTHEFELSSIEGGIRRKAD